jgi:hypothetical protein
MRILRRRVFGQDEAVAAYEIYRSKRVENAGVETAE